MKTQNGRMAYIRAMSTSLIPMSFMWIVRYGIIAKEAPLKKKRVNLRGRSFMLSVGPWKLNLLEPCLWEDMEWDMVLRRDGLGESGTTWPLAAWSSFILSADANETSIYLDNQVEEWRFSERFEKFNHLFGRGYTCSYIWGKQNQNLFFDRATRYWIQYPVQSSWRLIQPSVVFSQPFCSPTHSKKSVPHPA